MSDERLPDGKAGNLETLDKMRWVAHERKGHPLVRRLALAILESKNIPSHNHLDEAALIGTFVQKKVRYVKDAYGIEQLHDPVMMIEQIIEGRATGDCDDMTLLCATLLMSIGIVPKFRCVRYKTMMGNFNHIYLVVYEKNGAGPKRRLVIDCIVKDKPIGFEVPHASGTEFNI